MLRYLLIPFLLATAPNLWGQAEPPCACCEATYQDFHFWLGDWRVHAPGQADSLLGYNRITLLQDGCVMQENWASARTAYTGTSYNWYDKANERWNQIWIDNQGSSLHLTGHWSGEAMVLTSLPGMSGPRQRITWTPRADGSVRQHWEQSRDGGAHWETLFDGIYVAR